MITATIQKSPFHKNQRQRYGVEMCKFGLYFHLGSSYFYLGRERENYRPDTPFFSCMFVKAFYINYFIFMLFSFKYELDRNNVWEHYGIELTGEKTTFPVLLNAKHFYNLTIESVKGCAVDKNRNEKTFEGWVVIDCQPATNHFDHYKKHPSVFCSKKAAIAFYRSQAAKS